MTKKLTLAVWTIWITTILNALIVFLFNQFIFLTQIQTLSLSLIDTTACAVSFRIKLHVDLSNVNVKPTLKLKLI